WMKVEWKKELADPTDSRREGRKVLDFTPFPAESGLKAASRGASGGLQFLFS
ncbi:MAG: hypothetical protein H8D23_39740, partial [Candidatus Brocadiales bacterium]|nr:hypothetical protein [Candidatus Brocadiales bacterium]